MLCVLMVPSSFACRLAAQHNIKNFISIMAPPPPPVKRALRIHTYTYIKNTCYHHVCRASTANARVLALSIHKVPARELEKNTQAKKKGGKTREKHLCI